MVISELHRNGRGKSKVYGQSDIFRGPLFIVGMPRSGTKLLRGLLNEHSQVFIPAYETEFLPYWSSHWHTFGDLSDFGAFQSFYEKMAKTPFFHFMWEQGGQVISVQEWYNACSDYSLCKVFEALVRLSTGADENKIWGDKSPSYIRHVPLLKEVFPDAKVIHIVRDVRDYCLSINKTWGKNMIRAAQRWADDVNKARVDISRLRGDAIEILYENLLDDPVGVLKEICSFLGIEFEKTMVNLSQPTENIGDAKGIASVVYDNKEKWRQKMRPDVVSQIEALTWPVLKAADYPITYTGKQKRIGMLQMRWYQLLDGWNLVFNDPDGRWKRNLIFHLRYFRMIGNRAK